MTTERHFSEEEIAAIFEQAIEAQENARRTLTRREGLTLAELQEIGTELGITPEFIAKAAATSDVKSTADDTRTYFGLPVRVQRTIELPRAITDDEWDRLVVDLRETFQARGTIKRDGSLRQWTNGNLQALVEPTHNGSRLRLKSFLSSGRDGIVGGGVSIITGLIVALLFTTETTSFGPEFAVPIVVMLFGFILLSVYASHIPKWHRERDEQMEGIGKRIAAMMAGSTSAGFNAETVQESEAQPNAASTPRLRLDEADETDIGGTAERTNRSRTR